MREMMPIDTTTTSSVTQGTIWWASDDMYARAMNSKPKYASRVRGVGPRILPDMVFYVQKYQ